MPKYVLIFINQGDWRANKSEEDLTKIYAPIRSWWDELAKSGVAKGGQELKPQRTATSVRRVNGSMKVTDGPFIESKESVGGFALIEVDDLDKAIAIAKSFPGGDVEVRPVVEH